MQAQTVKERIEAITDKNLYLSGEQMAVKLYTTDTDGKCIGFSRVAYVELNGDPDNNIRLKVEMNGGEGQAVVKLPYSLPSGTYRLTAYTRWMRNEGERVFFSKRIGVFNSIRHQEGTDRAVLTDLAPTDDSTALTARQGNVTVSTDKRTYAPRQEVTVSIEGLTPDDRATLSVVRMDGLDTGGLAVIPASAKTREPEPCLPEEKGLIVEGVFTPHDKDGGTPEETNLTVQGNQINFYAGKTDPKGRVVFNTPVLKGMTEAVTTVRQGGHITLTSPFVATTPERLQPLAVGTGSRQALTERSIALQATEHFYGPAPAPTGEIEGFLSGLKPDKRYDLDLYRRFDTFEETFMEFMPGVSTKGPKGNRHVVVFDALNEVSDAKRNTLVLLDGVAIMNHELILAYDPHLVKYVETYLNDFAFGNQVYNGILFLKTPNLKLSGFDLPRTSVICDYEGVHPQTEMYLPSAAGDTPTHMPDLRHTLYWNPNVAAQDATLTFRTSDMRGTFVIKVEGRSKDGEKILGYALFEVK